MLPHKATLRKAARLLTSRTRSPHAQHGGLARHHLSPLALARRAHRARRRARAAARRGATDLADVSSQYVANQVSKRYGEESVEYRIIAREMAKVYFTLLVAAMAIAAGKVLHTPRPAASNAGTATHGAQRAARARLTL